MYYCIGHLFVDLSTVLINM